MRLKKSFRLILVTFLWLITTPVLAEEAEANAYLDFCSNHRIKNLFKIGGTVIYVIKVAVPIVIIALGTVDLFKAMLSGDEKDVSVATNSLLKRFIMGIIIFFIPSLVNAIFGIVDSARDENKTDWIFDSECYNCLMKPFTHCDAKKIGEDL